MNYNLNSVYTDEKFNNLIDSVVDLADENVKDFSGKFPNREKFKKAMSRLVVYKREKRDTASKDDLVAMLDRMIYFLPSTKIKKLVSEHFQAKLKEYCHHQYLYVGERTDVKYKSDNIVDLLEEIRSTKDAPQNNDKTFISKPFIIGNCYANANMPVYIPRKDVWTDDEDNRFCVCVHMCQQFQDYPVLNWGIRQICDGQKCQFGGRCSGARVFKNGKHTRKTVNLNRALLQGFRISGKQK